MSEFLLAVFGHTWLGQERQSAQQQHAPAAQRHAVVVVLDRALRSTRKI
jgi:hypothetical protein